MKAPLSKEIAKVIQNSAKARDLVKAVLRSRESDGAVVVMIDGQKRYYRPITALRRTVSRKVCKWNSGQGVRL